MLANIKIYKVAQCIFTLALAITEIDFNIFPIFNLQIVGYCRGVQYSQCCPSMTNINIYKSRRMHFCSSSHHYILKFLIFLSSESRSRSWSKIFAMTAFDSKYQNLQKTPTYFCTSSHRFRDINILNGQNQQKSSICFSASSYCFRDLKILILLPSKSM